MNTAFHLDKGHLFNGDKPICGSRRKVTACTSCSRYTWDTAAKHLGSHLDIAGTPLRIEAAAGVPFELLLNLHPTPTPAPEPHGTWRFTTHAELNGTLHLAPHHLTFTADGTHWTTTATKRTRTGLCDYPGSLNDKNLTTGPPTAACTSCLRSRTGAIGVLEHILRSFDDPAVAKKAAKATRERLADYDHLPPGMRMVAGIVATRSWSTPPAPTSSRIVAHLRTTTEGHAVAQHAELPDPTDGTPIQLHGPIPSPWGTGEWATVGSAALCGDDPDSPRTRTAATGGCERCAVAISRLAGRLASTWEGERVTATATIQGRPEPLPAATAAMLRDPTLLKDAAPARRPNVWTAKAVSTPRSRLNHLLWTQIAIRDWMAPTATPTTLCNKPVDDIGEARPSGLCKTCARRAVSAIVTPTRVEAEGVEITSDFLHTYGEDVAIEMLRAAVTDRLQPADGG